MALQSITNISIDFYDKKYIMVNAKQDDKNSRFLSITCYNRGKLYPINNKEHSAYIRYKKADNNSVFNFCEIDRQGKIIVELTEQMLASDGICYADLVIANKGAAKVNSQTGEIIGIENASILSTMIFHIGVTGSAVANSDIESSYEFDRLNIMLEKAEAEYTEVIKTSKSWAVGDTGIRDGEDIDNSKYYAKQSFDSAGAANADALSAAESKRIAGEHKDIAIQHSSDAYDYMTSASNSETKASNSASAAKTSETNAKTSETKAKTSETKAEEHKNSAFDYSILAQRYAVGGTNTAEDEDIDNAKYYYQQCRDAIVGNAVIGVKGNNETSYRKGNVNITAENVGAIPITDIATVDEIKTYLEIS